MKNTITPKTVLAEMKAALKMYGEYTFFDKGPHEVMDLHTVTDFLKKQSAPEVVKFITEVLGDSTDRYRFKVAASIICGIDDGPWTDTEWDTIIAINPKLY
jgi:hypothetical protein